jgi:hypothetical protein
MTPSFRRKAIVGAGVALLLVHVLAFASVWSDRQALQARARSIVAPGTPQAAVVARLTSYVHDELHHCDLGEVRRMPWLLRLHYLRNPFGIGPKTALDHGGFHEGSCESSARVLMEMLTAYEIPSRFVILSSDRLESLHTLLEVRYDGTWGAVDGLYNIVYRHPDGRPASVRELREDETLFLSNAANGWEYGYGPNGKSHPHRYNARKNVFRNAHYFNFDKLGALSLGLHRFLAWLGGEQATLWISRPNFYAYPALTTLAVLDTAAVGLVGVVAVAIGARQRFRRHPSLLLARSRDGRVADRTTS